MAVAGGDAVNDPLDFDTAAFYDDGLSERYIAPDDTGLDGSMWSGVRNGGSDFDDASGGDRGTAAATLKEHLHGQLNVDVLDPIDRLIGTNLIELVDDTGYLTGDIADVALRVGCDTERVETTLLRLQSFDPVGVFARSLGECLASQLKQRDRLDPLMQTFLAHLDLVAKRDTDVLIEVCGFDADDINDMIAEIRTLNPKPGFIFDTEVAQPIVPDVLVRPQPDGSWAIKLNNDTLPRVLVNRH